MVNAWVSITGRYPTSARSLLLEAGIPVIDAVGPDVLVWIDDGMVVRLDDQTLYLGDMAVAKGTPLMPDLVQACRSAGVAQRAAEQGRPERCPGAPVVGRVAVLLHGGVLQQRTAGRLLAGRLGSGGRRHQG